MLNASADCIYMFTSLFLGVYSLLDNLLLTLGLLAEYPLYRSTYQSTVSQSCVILVISFAGTEL